MESRASTIHDSTFRELMSHGKFALRFYQKYLPEDVKASLDFDTLEIVNLGAKTISDKKHTATEADIVHRLNRSDEGETFLWTHIEHQSKPEKWMPLRIVNYQTSQLLQYVKHNKLDKLPPIITILYHQGAKPYKHSVRLYELFADAQLAEKYFANPILVDLPIQSDQALKQDNLLGPVEMILKYIRMPTLMRENLQSLIKEMGKLDDKIRYILIYYLVRRADVPEQDLLNAIHENRPEDAEVAMTVGEQLIQRGHQQGMQKGMQKGVLQGMETAARNMLLDGSFEREDIMRVTGVSADILDQWSTQSH